MVTLLLAMLDPATDVDLASGASVSVTNVSVASISVASFSGCQYLRCQCLRCQVVQQPVPLPHLSAGALAGVQVLCHGC